MEGHGARVPDQDCLEYGRIADIGNRNDLTNAYFSRLVGSVSDVRTILLVWGAGAKARSSSPNFLSRSGFDLIEEMGQKEATKT